jgi:hypothetical protein
MMNLANITDQNTQSFSDINMLKPKEDVMYKAHERHGRDKK